MVGLHASHGTIRALGPAWRVEVGTGAGEGSGSDRSLGRVLVGHLAVTRARRGRPQRGITAHHLQTQWESLDRIVGGLEASFCQFSSDFYKRNIREYSQVVHIHVVERNLLELSILGVLEEKSREPVVAHIGLGEGRCAFRLSEPLSGNVKTEVAGTHDSVDVSGSGTGRDDGVSAASGKRTLSIVLQDGKGAFVLCGNRGDESRENSSSEDHLEIVFVVLVKVVCVEEVVKVESCLSVSRTDRLDSKFDIGSVESLSAKTGAPRVVDMAVVG